MIVRGALALIAAAAVVFGLTRLGDVNACNHAKSQGFAAALGKQPAGGPQRLARDVTTHCRGGADLAATSAALARAGALVPAAQLARAAIARDPRDYQGWIALAIVDQRRNVPAASRAAARRALALNPRYAGAQQLAAGARGGAPGGP